MLKIKLIALGSLSEDYWRSAFSEYKKRIMSYASFTVAEMKEVRIREKEALSDKEISTALDLEAKAIFNEIPKKSYVIALCIEGREYSSVEFAHIIEDISSRGAGEFCFIIGSSHGLSPEVKKRADLLMSMSKLTFPHQLARVMLAEAVYRSLNIIGGGKYHK